VKDMNLVSVFCLQRYPVFSATFVEEVVFSPLYIFGTFVKDQVDIAAWRHISGSVLQICFFPVPCFYCYGSIV
jgi:hypothetical protein